MSVLCFGDVISSFLSDPIVFASYQFWENAMCALTFLSILDHRGVSVDLNQPGVNVMRQSWAYVSSQLERKLTFSLKHGEKLQCQIREIPPGGVFLWVFVLALPIHSLRLRSCIFQAPTPAVENTTSRMNCQICNLMKGLGRQNITAFNSKIMLHYMKPLARIASIKLSKEL